MGSEMFVDLLDVHDATRLRTVGKLSLIEILTWSPPVVKKKITSIEVRVMNIPTTYTMWCFAWYKYEAQASNTAKKRQMM